MNTEILQSVAKNLQPHLENHPQILVEYMRNAGSLSGGLFTNWEGEQIEELNDWDKDYRNLLDPLSDYMMEEAKPGTFHRIFFSRDEAPKWVTPNAEEMLEISLQNLQRAMKRDGYAETQSLIVYVEEDGEWIVDGQYASKRPGEEWETARSSPHYHLIDEITCVRSLSGNNFTKIMLKAGLEGTEITSEPANPAWGWGPLDEDSLKKGGKLEARRQVIEAARKMRLEFFQSLGEVEEMVLAPLIGPMLMGGHSWPAGRPQFRVIHTANTTLVISDGLSDPFESERMDEELKYNGWNLEFYVEFPGKIPFDAFTGHYSMAMLGQMTQTAIGHTGIDGLIEHQGSLSITLSGAELPAPYANDEGAYGALLNVPSQAIPQKMQLNLESVYLVSMKLLTQTQLESVASGEKEDRQKLAATLAADGTHNLNPFRF